MGGDCAEQVTAKKHAARLVTNATTNFLRLSIVPPIALNLRGFYHGDLHHRAEEVFHLYAVLKEVLWQVHSE